MKRKVLFRSMEKTFANCVELSRKKNADYGGGKDALFNFALAEQLGLTSLKKAIAVRMTDKLSRISTLLNNEAQVPEETISETLTDLINYAAILKAAIEEKE
jgi:hypothetical protein